MQLVAHQLILVQEGIGLVRQVIHRVVIVEMLNKEIKISKHKMTTQVQRDHHTNIQNRNIGMKGVNKIFEQAQTNRNIQIQKTKRND